MIPNPLSIALRCALELLQHQFCHQLKLLLSKAYPKEYSIPYVLVAEGAQPWNLTLIGKFLGRVHVVARVDEALKS